jgi:hypothetical protein
MIIIVDEDDYFESVKKDIISYNLVKISFMGLGIMVDSMEIEEKVIECAGYMRDTCWDDFSEEDKKLLTIEDIKEIIKDYVEYVENEDGERKMAFIGDDEEDLEGAEMKYEDFYVHLSERFMGNLCNDMAKKGIVDMYFDDKRMEFGFKINKDFLEKVKKGEMK